MQTRRLTTVFLLGLCLALNLMAVDRADAAQRIKLNFTVLKVWVGKDCKVNVRLARKGPGRLPAKKLAGKVILGIKVGKRSYTYTFKQVDPAGRLLAGPAVIDFRSPIRVKGEVKISAMVDPKNFFTESRERRDNIAHAKGVPAACRGSNARVVLRALKVARVYPANGGLNVVITKKPGVKLDRATAGRIQLRVQSRVHRGSWPLDQVMAKGKRDSKGAVHFKTGLKANPGSPVRVSLKLGKLTRQRVFTLAAAKPTITAARPTIAATRQAGKPRRVPSSLKPHITRRSLMAKGRVKGYSHGLQLTMPAGDNRYAPGSAFFVNLQIPAGLASGQATCWVYPASAGYGSDFALNGYIVPYSGEAINQNVRVEVPESARGSERYYIIAVKNTNEYAFSDMFTVTGPADGEPEPDSTVSLDIRVAAPNRGHVEWIKGNTYTISWRVIGDGVIPTTYDVSLEKAGVRVRGIESSGAVWHANSRTFTLSWTIPSSVQIGDDYKIRVRHYGTDQGDVSEDNFSIRGVSDLILDWPPRPGFASDSLQLALRNTYHIRWHATGNYASSAVNIRLVSGQSGVPSVTLARGLRASTGSYTWHLGTNCGSNWRMPASNYRISVEIAGENRTYTSTSDYFSIVAPEVTVRSDQSGRAWQMGARKRISWIIRHMPENARLRIVLYKGNESWMDIARNVLASRLEFWWTVGAEAGVDLTPDNMGGPGAPPAADDYSIKVILEGCSLVSSQTIQFRIE